MNVRSYSEIERINSIRQEKIYRELLNDDLSLIFDDALENDIVLNMGPQHPATHGVLRVVLRLDGENIIKCVPELGYLHRGYEKLAENVTYHEFIPHSGGFCALVEIKDITKFDCLDALELEKLKWGPIFTTNPQVPSGGIYKKDRFYGPWYWGDTKHFYGPDENGYYTIMCDTTGRNDDVEANFIKEYEARFYD